VNFELIIPLFLSAHIFKRYYPAKKSCGRIVFMVNKSLALAILFLAMLPVSSCKKFDKKGYLQEAGVVLTFDDDRIDNWYKYLPLLDSAGVKATFYISKYNRLTAAQKTKLAAIQSHGHEIGYHTTNHYNMMDYVYKYHHTIEEMMRCEIEAGLKMMNRDGYYPVTFAYPYGAHNGIFDKELKRYFKSVRALNGSYDYAKSIAAGPKNDVLYGLGIDKGSNHSDVVINNVLTSARDNNGCVVFVAHNIGTGGNLSVTKDRLLSIINFVKNANMKFYKMAEISN
jgi:peptidoglycan-N-acetylglucosamine deacetylase